MHNPHELLPVAYRAAAAVANSRVLAEEAGERAIHLLTLAMLEGSPPQHPKAWLRVVARRSASALLRSEWARTRTIAYEEMLKQHAPYQRPPGAGTQYVRERVASQLSPRQRDALQAALTCNSTHAAARSCGMPPRDFRRYLGTICRKARHVVQDQPLQDPFCDDPAVLFRLGP